jgi:hypothetical protein
MRPKLPCRWLYAYTLIVCASRAGEIIGLGVVLYLLILLFLHFLFGVLLRLRSIVLPMFLLALQFAQVADDFFAVIQVEFGLIFFGVGSSVWISAMFPAIILWGLMGERGEVFGLLLGVLHAAPGLRGVPSIVERVPQVVDFVVSLVVVEADLLVEHVAIQLLLF